MVVPRPFWSVPRLLIVSILALTGGGSAGAEEPSRRPNVLFIAVDDLRPGQLGCYGNTVVKAPNIDRLAQQGVVFTRAYCQQAVCSPSRTSLLTGRRPDTTRVYDLETHFRDTIPDVVTLPQHFKQQGYHTEGLSKIYHGGLDDAASWSVPHWTPRVPGFGPEGQAVMQKLRQRAQAERRLGRDVRLDRIRGLPHEAPEVEDSALPDGATTDHALERLAVLKDQKEPFFLAVGYLKPHLPFVAPKKYWDLYDSEEITVPEVEERPAGAPDYAMSNWGELRQYVGIPAQGSVSDEQARDLIHGYYACVSYLDAQVGRLLDALDEQGLRENTIVILWGDHGWKLGEYGTWCKHTNYELDTRVPLIVSAPGRQAVGKASPALVEFVDIYPSLADLCGLPIAEDLEGTSFAPLLDEPDRTWKTAAFSQYPRGIPNMGRGMGYSMRTERYHLVAWTVPGKGDVAYELYDHETDPMETVNVADRPENAERVKTLAAQLHAGWQAARP